MGSQNSNDQLFYQLLTDLSQDIIHDTQSAADETINLTDQFLGEDKLHLVEDFRTICANDDSLTSEQLVITQQNMEQVEEARGCQGRLCERSCLLCKMANAIQML